MARRSKTGSRSSTRKPVTIDLEAEKVEAMAPSPDMDDSAKQAEPVALDGSADGETGAQHEAVETDTDGRASADFKDGGDAIGMDDAGHGTDGTEQNGDANGAGGPQEADPAVRTETVVKHRGLSALTGGVIGGLLALLSGTALQFSGVLPSPGSGSDAAVEAASSDIEPLRGEVDALQEELASLRANLADTANATSSDISAQLDAAIADVATAGETAEAARQQAGENSAAIEALSASVSQIESSVSGGGAGETAALSTLTSRLDGMEQEIATLSETVASRRQDNEDSADRSASAETTAQLRADFDGLSGTVEGLTGEVSAMAETVTGLSDSVSTVEEGQTTLSGEVAGLSERVTGLDNRIAEAEGTLAESGAGNTVAKAIAAAGLKSAMDRGTPFMSELEAFASVGGDESAVAALRDYAAAGVPTITQLIERFGPVANDIVATGQGLDDQASITDRLMSSARSLVQVRPVGEVEGDAPGAVAARMEARLKDSNLDAVVAQWETLPDAAKSVSEGFIAQVKARQTADDLVGSVLSGAMAATQPDNAG